MEQQQEPASGSELAIPGYGNFAPDGWWLHEISDALRAIEGEEEAASFCLPVCTIDCTDGEQYYEVLGAWCVPWHKVPHKPFLAAWFALKPKRRRALLAERKVFAAELDEDLWLQHMCDRDDTVMMTAFPPPLTFDVGELVQRGAVRCLTLWAEWEKWGRWAEHIEVGWLCREIGTAATQMLDLLRTKDCRIGGGDIDCYCSTPKRKKECIQRVLKMKVDRYVRGVQCQTCWMDRSGELHYKTYLQVDLPALREPFETSVVPTIVPPKKYPPHPRRPGRGYISNARRIRYELELATWKAECCTN